MFYYVYIFTKLTVVNAFNLFKMYSHCCNYDIHNNNYLNLVPLGISFVNILTTKEMEMISNSKQKRLQRQYSFAQSYKINLIGQLHDNFKEKFKINL